MKQSPDRTKLKLHKQADTFFLSFYHQALFFTLPYFTFTQTCSTSFLSSFEDRAAFTFTSVEISSRVQDRENQTLMNSPRSNNGIQIPTPPHTPNTIPRSDSNPYPTTYVQADTSSFKQVVQMLTGSSDTTKPAPCSKPHLQDPVPSSRNFNIPPMKTTPKKQQQQQGFKLYERRNYNNSLKNSLMINTFMMQNSAQICSFSPSNSKILSPSLLDFPSLALSPVTPLNDDPFDKSSPSLGSSSEEEKAIADKGFYLHPSPMSTPRGFEPQLLPLFPVTTPRVSESPS